jgi:hypothetical protein
MFAFANTKVTVADNYCRRVCKHTFNGIFIHSWGFVLSMFRTADPDCLLIIAQFLKLSCKLTYFQLLFIIFAVYWVNSRRNIIKKWFVMYSFTQNFNYVISIGRRCSSKFSRIFNGISFTLFGGLVIYSLD